MRDELRVVGMRPRGNISTAAGEERTVPRCASSRPLSGLCRRRTETSSAFRRPLINAGLLTSALLTTPMTVVYTAPRRDPSTPRLDAAPFSLNRRLICGSLRSRSAAARARYACETEYRFRAPPTTRHGRKLIFFDWSSVQMTRGLLCFFMKNVIFNYLRGFV